MILVPSAMAQDTMIEEVERTVMDEGKDDLELPRRPLLKLCLNPHP
jgi:hypothetical protein